MPAKTYRYLGVGDDRTKYELMDSQFPLEFKVRKSDYTSGICGDVERCALSKALRRTNRDILKVYTGLSFAFVVLKDSPATAIRFSVPRIHRDSIEFFDKTGMLTPGVYRFGVVSPSQRLGYKIGSSGTAQRSGVVKNVFTKPPMAQTVPSRRVTSKSVSPPPTKPRVRTKKLAQDAEV